jgi:hypothetical protein
MTQALSGDVIAVAPGTYNITLGESFPIILKSGVQLLGTGDPEQTILNATGDPVRQGIIRSSGKA